MSPRCGGCSTFISSGAARATPAPATFTSSRFCASKPLSTTPSRGTVVRSRSVFGSPPFVILRHEEPKDLYSVERPTLWVGQAGATPGEKCPPPCHSERSEESVSSRSPTQRVGQAGATPGAGLQHICDCVVSPPLAPACVKISRQTVQATASASRRPAHTVGFVGAPLFVTVLWLVAPSIGADPRRLQPAKIVNCPAD